MFLKGILKGNWREFEKFRTENCLDWPRRHKETILELILSKNIVKMFVNYKFESTEMNRKRKSRVRRS